MAKKKTPFFERLLAKNAEQENQGKNDGQKTSKSKKSKSWKISLTSGLLIGVIGTGITVPLVINSVKKNTVGAYDKDTDTLTSKTGNIDLKIKLGELEKNYSDTKKPEIEEQLNALDKIILYYLYNKEQAASVEYQKLWNESRKDNEAESNSYRLPTIDELKDKFKKELQDIESNMKLQFGTDNWETEFNKHLVEKYSGAKTVDEAIKNKVFSHIRSDALRRFRLSSGTDKKNEIDRKNKNNEYVYKWWRENSDKKFIEQDDESKLALATESYVFDDKYKLATPFINSYVENEKPSLMSEFTIPGIAPAKKNDKWKIDKNIFLRYLFAGKIGTFGLDKVTKGYDIVKNNFKPFDSYIDMVLQAKPLSAGIYKLPDAAIQYSTILSYFSKSADAVKNNWGTKGLTSISEFMTGDNYHLFLANSPDLLFKDGQTTNFKEIDLFGELEKIRKAIAKEAGIEDSKLEPTNNTEAYEYNKKIETFFTDVNESQNKGLTEKKFEELILKPFAALFENNNKIQTVYRIKGLDNVVGILSSEGFKLLYYKTGITSADITIMIKNDFYLSKKYEKQLGVRYNALSKIGKELPRDKYILELLKEDDFKKHLLTQNNLLTKEKDKDGKPKKDVKYTEQDIRDLISAAQRSIKFNQISNFIKLSKDVSKWMDTRAKNEYDELFTVKNGKTYFNKNDQDTAASLALEYMKKKFGLSN
ncbi:HinT-interacting membrane complex protein P80 [Mycoplasmopsis primatum]|uniref:HinT-interacting membrane complex protein P80 n=1 Tax=Mycoplasmopsis primatum TaxID=55604 RepID=UPI00049614AA|nr:hypothetical protein [Mycoplasmopsis primatum]